MKQFIKKNLEKLPFYDGLMKPYHLMRAGAAGARYGFPGRKVRVIAVTGTNGKTTTSFLIWKMLNNAGHKTGLMTTVAWGGVGGNEKDLHEQMEHMTTVSSDILNKRISQIVDEGAEFLVLEVTSHALAQYRTLGVPVEIGVFTNLTHEHLDYHKTMENYREAKGKLFEKAKFAVLNADDKATVYYKKKTKKYITYGINKGDKRATGVEMRVDGVKYACGDIKIETKLPGIFNVYNSLAAVCVGEKLGLAKEEIEKGIASLAEVEGRTTVIDEGQDFLAMIDYAHTPDAFEKLLPDMKKSAKGRLIVMFGSAGGRRDATKRGPQGEIAGKYADIVILTEEDDRETPGAEILEQIKMGAEKVGKREGKDLFIEPNRTRAIKKACEVAKKDDVVLFLGKGHEKTIERADGEHAYYEPDEVRKALKALKSK